MRALCLFLIALLSVILPSAAMAQDPLVEIDFEQNSAIPGQPLSLRVTVLVPTWLPKPVVFPSFEAPNILVQLPEGSSGPTSRDVNGETWSGVSRRYRISPMAPGQFQIPAQDIVVTWAEPGQTEPKSKTIAIKPVTIVGAVPDGAEDLMPFVAAENLTVSSEISETNMPMAAGDSLTVTVTAKIEGASAIFLPQLLPDLKMPGMAKYPAEPVILDSENRGIVSGTRTESITLIAESGGQGDFPQISIEWYNLSSKSVETAFVDGFDVVVDAPGAPRQRLTPQVFTLYLLATIVLVVIVWFALRRLAPVVRSIFDTRRAQKLASEKWAYEQVLQAVKRQDYGLLLQTLDIWSTRCAQDPSSKDTLQSALSDVGKSQYSLRKTNANPSWMNVKKEIVSARYEALESSARFSELPPLNPRSTPHESVT